MSNYVNLETGDMLSTDLADVLVKHKGFVRDASIANLKSTCELMVFSKDDLIPLVDTPTRVYSTPQYILTPEKIDELGVDEGDLNVLEYILFSTGHFGELKAVEKEYITDGFFHDKFLAEDGIYRMNPIQTPALPFWPMVTSAQAEMMKGINL